MKNPLKSFHQEFGPVEDPNAQAELLKMLGEQMKSSKGFIVAAIFNQGDRNGAGFCAAGEVTFQMMSDLLSNTLSRSVKLARSSKAAGEICQCPKCRAEREKGKPGSTQYH